MCVCVWESRRLSLSANCTLYLCSWCACPPFLCMCVGVSANRSVRWDAAESSCHSLTSTLAAFTFHLRPLEMFWPEWSCHNNALTLPNRSFNPACTHTLCVTHTGHCSSAALNLSLFIIEYSCNQPKLTFYENMDVFSEFTTNTLHVRSGLKQKLTFNFTLNFEKVVKK